MKNRRHPAFSRVMDAVAAYSPRTQGNDPAALASTLSAVHRRFPVPPGGTSARLLIPRLRSLAGAPLPLSSPPIRIWLKPLHLAIGLRQPVRPVLSLNASHAVLKCSLASLRLLALPNGGPGCALGRPDPDARRALAGVADATDKPKGGGP